MQRISKSPEMTILTNEPSTPYSRTCSPVATGIIALLLSLLCACIPVTKRPVSPIEPPRNFSLPGEVPFQTRWWLDFQDNTLTSLIDQAIGDNFSLRATREKINETEAIARQAGAALVPGVDGLGAIASTRDHTTDSSRETLSLGLAASYEIDLWGRVRSQRDAAILEAKATEADYHTAVISLTAQVALTWYQLIEADLQLELLQKQQETNAKVLQLISAQFRAGKVGIADVLQQRQLVESTIGNLAGLRAERDILANQLAILLGVVPTNAAIPRRMQLPSLPPLPKTGIPLDLLDRRPDVDSSLRRLQAADNRVAAAMADRLPRLSISADLSTSGEKSGDLFNNWFSTLGANLFSPLFDGGRRKAEVARNVSIAEQLYYKHGQALLEAIAEVENSLIREKEQQIILGSLETQLQYAAKTIDNVTTRYRQGAENYQRVLLALLSHQNIQRSILTSRRQLIAFRISLYRALSGRLTPADIDPVTANSSVISASVDHPSMRQ
jgi:NodT family efflux transporter outer membrane factor (OMF) lipoprotein